MTLNMVRNKKDSVWRMVLRGRAEEEIRESREELCHQVSGRW